MDIFLVVFFAYLLGVVEPFSDNHGLNILYNYAGGIEEGSAVRVMGIKVGKVKQIEFVPGLKDSSGQEVKLRLKVSIQKKAWATIRKDSRFYINLAGIIGEKFIDISPGSDSQPEFSPNASVRGEDPPRIDQLLSQGYGLAGKLLDIVEKNEGSLTSTLEKVNSLVTNLNKTLALLDKASNNSEAQKIFKNIGQITSDVAVLTQKLNSDDGQKTLDLLHRLIWRLEGLDAQTVRKFLQEEGIRAKIF